MGIEREGRAQRNYGEALLKYREDMGKACGKMIEDLETARDHMRDKSGIEAIELVKKHMEAIIATLSGNEEFGRGQKKQGENIMRAEDFEGQWGRRRK